MLQPIDRSNEWSKRAVVTNAWFKPGAFFVSSNILGAKPELTSKAAGKTILLRLLQVIKNSKASDSVS